MITYTKEHRFTCVLFPAEWLEIRTSLFDSFAECCAWLKGFAPHMKWYHHRTYPVSVNLL